MLQFNGIQSAVSGTASVLVVYDNASTSSLDAAVVVDGKQVGTIKFPSTGSWTTLATASINVPLTAGTNTIIFRQPRTGAWVAEIDKITVSAPVASTPPPTPTPTPTPTPQPTPDPVPPPTTGTVVSLTSFGSVGQGGNDTSVFQSAINATANSRETLRIPAGTYNVQPLHFPSNASIVVDAGATVQATSGYTSDQRMLYVVDVSNVSITGTPGKSIFSMRKSEYTSGEYRHCLDIEGANNVTVYGISCNNSGGDGLYIGNGRQGYSSNVSVKQSSFDNNRRQGFSLISGRNILIDGCSFTNTSGTAPQSGIDIEPNVASDILENIVITNSRAAGNSGQGFMVSIGNLTSSSQPISISGSNLVSESNGQSGYFATNEHDSGAQGVSGTVTITNSSSSNDRAYGAVASFYDANSAALVFDGLTVSNANGSGSTYDGAAIGVKRGGGDSSLMGGVTFTGTSITATNGKLTHYFTVEDYSGSGMQSISFRNWKTLSGIPSGQSLGVVNGSSVNSFSIP